MNPVRIMAHQTPFYAHDCQRYAGACAGVARKPYLAQRWKNSLDHTVLPELRRALLVWTAGEAAREKWRKAPKGTYKRLIWVVCLEVACEGPGWTHHERARQADLHMVEYRRYRSAYEAIWHELNEWVAIGHRQISRNEWSE